MKIFNMTFMLTLMLLTSSVFSQTIERQDRTAEVEAEIRREIVEYVARFIPDDSFSVGIKIIPLKRQPQSQTGVDILPFYESSENEVITEEWENPDTSFYVLLNRIQEAQVNITIDEKYNIKNEAEFRDNLFKSTGLVIGRDKLEIKMADLAVFEKKFTFNDINWNYVVIGLVSLLSLSLIFYGIHRFSPHKSQAASGENNRGDSAPVSSAGAMALGNSAGTFQGGVVASGAEMGKIKGDINFTDSLKLNSHISERINSVLLKNTFPSLVDLRNLEEFLAVDAHGFSYFISHFDAKVKDKLLSLGRSQEWIKGFAEVGAPSREILLYLEKMVHTTRSSIDETFEHVLIQCWRLDDQLKDFLLTIPKDEAKYILYRLPKSQSLSVARDMFPGDWAFMLSDKTPMSNTTSDRWGVVLQKALEIKPYYNPGVVQVFKSKEELVSYLRSCGPDEERDIYQSIDSSHSLNQIRPPFYIFFELEEDKRMEIYRLYDLKTWALACFNVSRTLRKKLDDMMSEKEKYLFRTYLTDMDKFKPNSQTIADVRQAIATEMAQRLKVLIANNKKEQNTKEEISNEQAA